MCRIFAVMAIRAVPPRSAADRTTRRSAATVDRIDAMEPLIAYLPNPFFVVKMLLYIAIATLSIKPTTSFIRWRRRLAGSGELPPTPAIATARRRPPADVRLLALHAQLAGLTA